MINDNLTLLLTQCYKIIFSPFNRLLILAVTAQVASMITKGIINSIKAKKISFKDMATYGGMPSSHTVFIVSFVFGIAFDKDYGWQHPFFAFAILISSVVLIDAVRLRGTIDKINLALQKVIDTDKKLKEEIDLPKLIAHKISEILVGVLFSFCYTFLFYLLFYHFFNRVF